MLLLLLIRSVLNAKPLVLLAKESTLVTLLLKRVVVVVITRVPVCVWVQRSLLHHPVLRLQLVKVLHLLLVEVSLVLLQHVHVLDLLRREVEGRLLLCSLLLLLSLTRVPQGHLATLHGVGGRLGRGHLRTGRP
jgi:hypothetical protein